MNKNINHYIIPKTLSQSIYNYLRNAIINNKLKANQRINEKEIAQLFDISTTPVREAVLRLGAEGFVKVNSHREAVVREITFEELKEIFQVLGVLDSMGSSLAADHVSSETLKEIEDLTDEMERHCHMSSIEKYMALNTEIHQRIWDCIPHRFLRQVLYYVSGHMFRYNAARAYAFGKAGVLERSLEEHKEILHAFKIRDKKKLKTLMLRHWGSILRSFHFEEGLKEYLSMNEGR